MFYYFIFVSLFFLQTFKKALIIKHPNIEIPSNFNLYQSVNHGGYPTCSNLHFSNLLVFYLVPPPEPPPKEPPPPPPNVPPPPPLKLDEVDEVFALV